ncbi:MAG: tRNA lysidine(34) synthetase TilS, partial [Oscillospiraceae bacterium]|nr:tRNA lysidine(34) synthetase TilS [Oscillospiraceae bacterium]
LATPITTPAAASTATPTTVSLATGVPAAVSQAASTPTTAPPAITRASTTKLPALHGLEITAVHVNHMLRGAEADRDQEFVRNFCTDNSIPLICISTDVTRVSRENKISIEEAGRNERYRIFNCIAKDLVLNQGDVGAARANPTDEPKCGARTDCTGETQCAGRDFPVDTPQRIERVDPVDTQQCPGRVRIAVAHNAGDQAETVILNLIRGAGIDGLGGMKSLSGKVIRPMLNISRREIESYLNQMGIYPLKDSTNSDCSYTRNRIRTKLIPLIREDFNPDIEKSLNTLAEIASIDSDYLSKAARDVYLRLLAEPISETGVPNVPNVSNSPNASDVCSVPCASTITSISGANVPNVPNVSNSPNASDVCSVPCASTVTSISGANVPNVPDIRIVPPPSRQVSLQLASLKGLHKAILSRVIRMAATDVRNRGRNFGSIHVMKIIDLIIKGNVGKTLHLPDGLRIRRTYDKLMFFLEESDNARQTALVCQKASLNKTFCKKSVEVIEQYKNIGYNSLVQFFDADAADHERFELRTRQKGDVFFSLGSPGTKKLKKYFIDRKVPEEKRDAIPVLAFGRDIVWVIGYGVSERFKVTDKTQTVMRIEYVVED